MNVITISREFGSGGREVGKRLADALGYAYYDTEIIDLIAKKAGMDKNYVSTILESSPSYAIHFGATFSAIPLYDNTTQVLIAQKQVFEELMSKGNCVIVGRGSSCLVGSGENVFSIFVYADMPTKVARCLARDTEHKETAKSVEKMIKKIDKNRRHYTETYFGVEWGKKENYSMTINTSGLEIKKIVPGLASYIRGYFEGK